MLSTTELATEEIDRTGKRLFAQWRAGDGAHVSPELFIVFDVRSGDFEVADSDLDATKRLMDRRPEGSLWGRRVGGPVYRLKTPRWK